MPPASSFPVWSKTATALLVRVHDVIVYSVQVKKEPWLVSVTVAMTTSQLLLLLSSGEVVVVVHTQQQKRPQTKPVVHLKDFCVRYHMPGSQVQLFSIHTHYGIFCKGELRSVPS